MFDHLTRRPVCVAVVYTAVWSGFLIAVPASFRSDYFVSKPFEGRKIIIPDVSDVGVPEAHVVSEFFLEVLEQHDFVFNLYEVQDPVRPRVIVWSEREEHVDVVSALVHLVPRLEEVVWACVPEAPAAGAIYEHPVGLQGLDDNFRKFCINDFPPEGVVHVRDVFVEPEDGEALRDGPPVVVVAQVPVTAHEHGDFPLHGGRIAVLHGQVDELPPSEVLTEKPRGSAKAASEHET